MSGKVQKEMMGTHWSNVSLSRYLLLRFAAIAFKQRFKISTNSAVADKTGPPAIPTCACF